MHSERDSDHSDQPAEARPTSYSRVSLSLMTGSVHANLLGNIHGGEIMKLADSTAGAVAQRHSGGPAVTAAMDQMAFLHPVYVGDIVRASGQVNWAGRSSMEIGVRVEAQPWNSAANEPRHVASAYFVFVAVDASGQARPVPELLLESAVDVRRHREAGIRRQHRLARRTEIERGRA
ncbi:acyl-CoA thioesterase [Nocardioides sp. 616]|uniref:acyl-CoA thioesterase n=1 Tax=Nocardioides sp. 616 TaxID=2268090 RepID=UPI000CE43245|nr:acyl-CoA thioesterase [Nocardioides sp. 616]